MIVNLYPLPVRSTALALQGCAADVSWVCHVTDPSWGWAMRLRQRFVNLCWAVLADTLADLEGIIQEIRDEAARTRAIQRPTPNRRADRGRDERRRPHAPREHIEAHEPAS